MGIGRIARTWRRLFPARGLPGAAPPPCLARVPVAAVLALIAGALFFSRLGCPLLEPEEARYAEIPRQMLAEGRFAEPVWHGAPYYHKPPLLYWLVMLSYTLFGVHDWAARLVPALAGVGTVLVTYLWGRRAVGPWAGFLAGLILCLTPRFVYLGRMLVMDGLLCFFVVSALACAHLVVSGKASRRWWCVSALACGLGVLTKGPVTAVLVLGPVVAYQILDRRAWRPPLRWYLLYQGIALAVAGPWYTTFALRQLYLLVDFFWSHNVRRFVAPVDHEEPVWFFVPDLLLGTLPWALLLIPLVGLLRSRTFAAARRRPAELGFFLLAFAICVGFFSASRCKRAVYILPALPTLALALGTVLAGSVSWRGAAERIAKVRLGHWAAGLALLGGVGLCALAGVERFWEPATAVALGAVVLLAWGAVMWCRRRLAERASWGICALTMLALLLVVINGLMPGYHRRFAHRGQVRPQAGLADGVAVICYPKRWDSVSFYLRRDDVRFYRADERAALVRELEGRARTVVFVKRGRDLDEFLKALPPSLEFVPAGRVGNVVVPGVVTRRERPDRAQGEPGASATGGE